MENNTNHKNNIKRWLFGVIIIMILLASIGLTRLFSEQNGSQSDGESRGIANSFMESLIDYGYPINRNDVFWKLTANMIVRKAAHFLEYLLMGLLLSMVLNILTKKLWLSSLIAMSVCIILAYLDEYRQQFVIGRHSTWFDVRIDSYGAITGIVLTTIFFIIYYKIKKLRAEIKMLEEKLGSIE
jgi:hypothetical protein